MTDNPAGYAPVVGDILQGGQAIYDFSQGDWKNGLLNASLLVVPNIVEKPLRLGIKAAKATVSNAVKTVGEEIPRYVEKIKEEIFSAKK